MKVRKKPVAAVVTEYRLHSHADVIVGKILEGFRHDGGEIEMPFEGGRLETGRRKFGAVLGDGVKTGCNSVLSPGVIVGCGTQIYAGVVLRPGIYPAHSIVKLRQEQIVVARRT